MVLNLKDEKTIFHWYERKANFENHQRKSKTIFLIDDKKVESLRNEMKPDYYGVILIHVKVQTKIKVGVSSPKQYF